MTRYPFKFLDSYEREDRAFFFGRDEEIERLYEMVFQADLILLYGASGTGKTSLIQCGLASKFESHDWLPLHVRRGAGINAALDAALRAAGGEALPEELDWLDEDLSGEGPAPAAAPATPLARRLRAVYLKHFKPIYLIFDQFEELYVLGSRQEQEAFILTVQDLLHAEQPVKIILSIREEYLGHLYEFERQVPELLRKKLRIEPMNLERVKTVILGVGQQTDGNVRLEAGQEAAIAEGIFEKIRGKDKTLHIPLPYLQVFLDKFYLQVMGDESRQAEATFTRAALAGMGDLGDVLRNFLDEQAAAISREQGLPEAEVWRALSPFVTLEGTKEPLSETQLAARLTDLPAAAPQRLLQAFVRGRILRFSEASQLYEVAHDALAKQIHAKRSDEEIAILEVQRLVKSQTVMKAEAREYFTEKQLLFMEPYLEKLVLGEAEKGWVAESRAHRQAERAAEERRQQEELEVTRRRLRVVRGLLALALLAVGVAGFLGYQSNKQAAELKIASDEIVEKSKETERQKEEIERHVTELEQKEAELESSLAAAEAARDTAEMRRITADLATVRAQRQEQAAQDALAKLENANASTVELLLSNAERDILNLHYEDALEKLKAAASLGALKPKVAAALLEIGFWHGEAGNSARAVGILDTAAVLVGNTAARQLLQGLPRDATGGRLQLRQAMHVLDAARFAHLFEQKYYPEMIAVPGGAFEMGCDTTIDKDCESDETPHKCTVSSFQMAKYETTWWQYYLFCQATGHEYESPSWGTLGDNPVVNVSWFDAVLYSNWVNNRLGLDTFYDVGNKGEGDFGDYYDVRLNPNAKKGYRLPTEAEWEYAAKGGPHRSPFVYAGSDAIDSVAWYSGNSGSRTRPAGEKKANALGLYDMSGNVWEWCWDWYDDYPEAPAKDYAGPESGSYRVIRGGSWDRAAEGCRSAYRSYTYPDNRFGYDGFRLVFVPQ